ncbi:cryptochrome/photolyase family protein [Candidatus Dependentiae bacterium]
MYKKSIFIFRRSLRISDNMGLLKALKLSKKVVPIFIFTPEQILKNSYKSDNAVQFMVESLSELDKELKKKDSKLFYFFGKPHEVVKDLIKNNKIEAVFANVDYTPYSISRDKKICKVCEEYNVDFKSYEDLLLNPIGSFLTGSNTPFKKYTPYYNKAKKNKIKPTAKNRYKNYISNNYRIKNEFKGNIGSFYKKNNKAAVKGGRKNALLILKKMKKFKDYDKKRNILIYETTKLSAYIKFGCVSIREVCHVINKSINSKDLIKQLYWRDFYYNIAFFFPHVFGHAMKEKYDKISWPNKKSLFEKWKKGKTGFPIVDACMRQLNETGFMHNRGRLITSNFLIKILLIDWKKGEQYFAQKLIDYDPSVNNGNWQWSSSTGADSQPYFRIFNPWLQSKKFDSACEYIKKWVPELREVNNADIQKWHEKCSKYKEIDYPKPIVDYAQIRKKSMALYKKYT